MSAKFAVMSPFMEVLVQTVGSMVMSVLSGRVLVEGK